MSTVWAHGIAGRNVRHRVNKPDPARFWNAAAQRNAAWHVATGYRGETQAFFAQGSAEVDRYLSFCGLALEPSHSVVEIGCGVGRMTRRLAERSGRVVATDVSARMLERCRANLSDFRNVDYVRVDGTGTLPLPADSADLVFSYITLQHVPLAEHQLTYLTEAVRVLWPGGRFAVQVRATGLRARAYDWLGHAIHLLQGHQVLGQEWRGARVSPAQVRARLSGLGVEPRFLDWNARHVWITGTKPPHG